MLLHTDKHYLQHHPRKLHLMNVCIQTCRTKNTRRPSTFTYAEELIWAVLLYSIFSHSIFIQFSVRVRWVNTSRCISFSFSRIFTIKFFFLSFFSLENVMEKRIQWSKRISEEICEYFQSLLLREAKKKNNKWKKQFSPSKSA